MDKPPSRLIRDLYRHTTISKSACFCAFSASVSIACQIGRLKALVMSEAARKHIISKYMRALYNEKSHVYEHSSEYICFNLLYFMKRHLITLPNT